MGLSVALPLTSVLPESPQVVTVAATETLLTLGIEGKAETNAQTLFSVVVLFFTVQFQCN